MYISVRCFTCGKVLEINGIIMFVKLINLRKRSRGDSIINEMPKLKKQLNVLF